MYGECLAGKEPYIIFIFSPSAQGLTHCRSSIPAEYMDEEWMEGLLEGQRDERMDG